MPDKSAESAELTQHHRIRDDASASRSTRPRACKWLSAMAAQSDGDDVVVDTVSGTFGHRTSMLDFSPRDLERFRKIGEVVEVTGEGGESALALSGSAAQSKIQSFPGDADFFQRINIKAATREEACGIMARLMRDHVLSHLSGPTYQFLEAKLGSYPDDGFVRGEAVQQGQPGDLEGSRDRSRRAGAGCRGRHADHVALGRGRPRSRLVQARLGRHRSGAQAAVERQQRHRRDLGGARRRDRLARRLPRRLLPGGVPRRRPGADVREGREVRLRRRARRVRRRGSRRRCTST